jgi:metabotropic glutamate receptor 5
MCRLLRTCIMLWMLLLFWLPSSIQHDIYVPELPYESYESPGSLVLGSLMTVHRSSLDGHLCGEQVRDMGVLQRIEAVAFAIREVNENPALLPNHTLGFVMYDDCFTDVTALGQALHFARVSPQYNKRHATAENQCVVGDENFSGSGHEDPAHQYCIRHVRIIGLLGSESSITTVEAANMMSLFRIPHISYMASSRSLSNKVKYPGFFRTVPSDAVQAKAVVAILRHFEWTFVNVLYSRGEYGEEAFKSLVKETENTNICFNMIREIHNGMTHLEYVGLVWDIVNNESVNVSVVVVFAPSYQGKDLLKAASSLPGTKGRITWIASNTWVNHLEELDEKSQQESLGMLSLTFESTNIPRFDEHFQNITLGQSASLNPWIGQFWKTFHNCSVTFPTETEEHCTESLHMADHPKYIPDKAISLVFDGVYTFAYALDSVLKGPCYGVTDSELYPCITKYLQDALRVTNFTGNDGNQLSFDDNGDRLPANYHIQNVQDKGSGKFKLVNVGMYIGENNSLIFNGRDIHWTTGNEKPTSVCSVKCLSDEGTVYNQKRCCWTCEKCRPDEILWRLGQSEDIWFCMSCPENQWPNATDRTQCVEIIPHWLSIYDPLGTGMAALATIGILLCIAVFVVFVVNDSHVLVKASSRELMFFMLGGLIVCYIFVFIFLIKPTEKVCILKMMGVSVSFTLIYSPMSIKSIRIYRIFQSGKKMNRKLRLVSCCSQLMMATTIVLVHVSTCRFSWMISSLNRKVPSHYASREVVTI